MFQLNTARLILREFSVEDAPFVLDLVNDPDWIKFIGDRGLRTLDDAKIYVAERLQKSYQKFGFGMWLVQRKEDGEALGMCGLLKREYLENLDVGFGFLPSFRGQGYAFEAAKKVMKYAREELQQKHLAAFAQVDNNNSIKLLDKLGFNFEGMLELPDDDAEIKLFQISF